MPSTVMSSGDGCNRGFMAMTYLENQRILDAGSAAEYNPCPTVHET